MIKSRKRLLLTNHAILIQGQNDSSIEEKTFHNCIALSQSFSVIVMHLLAPGEDLTRDVFYSKIIRTYFPKLLAPEDIRTWEEQQIWRSAGVDAFLRDLLMSVQRYHFTVADLNMLVTSKRERERD